MPPDKNMSTRKFTLWVIVLLVFLTFQFVLTFTGHRQIDADVKLAAAAAAAACPTAQSVYYPMLSP